MIDTKESLESFISYSNSACIPTGLNGEYQPTHLVDLRLDDETPYVHGYSILRGVDKALSRPGIEAVSLDRFNIRKKIANNLLLSVGDNGHKSHFGDIKPAVEIVVSFADGVQRKIYGYDFGSKIEQKNDPIPLTIRGLGDIMPKYAAYIASKLDWVNRPGLFIANWMQLAASAAFNEIMGNNSDKFSKYEALIHSVTGFTLPAVMDVVTQKSIGASAQVNNIRPLKNVPDGYFVSTKTNLVNEDGRRFGGGVVNFAMIPD